MAITAGEFDRATVCDNTNVRSYFGGFTAQTFLDDGAAPLTKRLLSTAMPDVVMPIDDMYYNKYTEESGWLPVTTSYFYLLKGI